MLLELQRELALESDIGTVLGRITAAATSLLGAVRALAQRIDGTAGTHVLPRSVDATRRLSPEAEAGAFHVIREAVTNAIKTGRASTVSIDVRDDGAGLTALVEDDGLGFDVAATLSGYASRGSLGMLQMRESARLIGAQLTIDPSPGHGTRVRLHVPS